MIGRTLAHYEIRAALGKGGMGEVYLARDTKLGRDVAIKTLPDEYARDPERLARFEREARFLATLQHPNIAGIHGLEESAGTRFLVLELVDGATLADRLHAPLRPPTREALGLALQIAQALEGAHAKGVVHRDLKPANIKITPSGQVKVLDFGLAKALDTGDGGGLRGVSRSGSSSISAAATGQGVLLGTADYMSPEQARGEAVDLRADIWAFGCVLYEMLTGQNAFAGRTLSDVLAAVLKSDPDWSRLPPDLHPRVQYLLERCLRKEPRERPAHVAEVRAELEKALADPDGAALRHGAPRARPRLRLVGAAAAVLAGVASFAAGTAWLDTSEPLPLMRFGFAPASRSLPEIPSVAMASDGARLAYTTLDRLWVRGLAEAEPVVVTGPTGWIGTPAFSPSGSAIAYVNAPTANGPFSIMRVPVGGGTPATIHIGISSLPTDLDWDARERVTYVQPDGIWEVPAAGGGDARLVIAAEEGETLASPQRLPDGESMLFTSTKAQGRDRWNEATVFVATPQSTGAERRVVREHASDARYVPSGHVIFADGSTLWAAPFSSDSAAMGERFRIVDQVLRAPSGASDTAHYAVSANGALVHLGVGAEDPAATAAGGGGFVMLGAPQQFSLVWVDRMGNEEPIDVRRDRYASVRLSPDGNRAAVVIGGNPIAGEPRDIWILDVRTNDISRLTSDGQSDAPIWLDNDRIIYRTAPPPVGVFSVAVDGGEPQLLRRAPSAPTAYPMGLTPDRRTLLVLNAPNIQQQNMLTLALDGDSDYVPLLEEPGVQSFTSVSPNGKFVVYHQGPSLNETSVVVRPFPAVALRSYTVDRGSHPIFSRDGSEIFYFDGETIVAVPVAYEPFDLGTPVRLGLRGPYFYGANRTWDEAPDGRFLMARMGEPEAAQIAQGSLQIQVIVGLSGVLEQRTR